MSSGGRSPVFPINTFYHPVMGTGWHSSKLLEKDGGSSFSYGLHGHCGEGLLITSGQRWRPWWLGLGSSDTSPVKERGGDTLWLPSGSPGPSYSLTDKRRWWPHDQLSGMKVQAFTSAFSDITFSDITFSSSGVGRPHYSLANVEVWLSTRPLLAL